MKDRATTDVGPFAIVPLWLLKSGLSDGAIATFALMWAKWADRGGECWPSHTSIAAERNVSERTIRNHLAELTEIGAVTTVARHRDDGAQTSNFYVLHAAKPPETSFQGGGENLQGGVDESFQGGLKPVADEPYPDEPDPSEPFFLSDASHPTTTIDPSPAIGLVDSDPSGGDSVNRESHSPEEVARSIVDSDSDKSDQEPTISPVVARAIDTLVGEGHDPADVRSALTSTDGGDAPWTGFRGKPYDPELLADAVRLAVAFSDACAEAGNRKINPFTHKECNPMRMLMMTDEKPARHIKALITWTFQNDFWHCQVLSASKFRAQWDKLAGQRRTEMKKKQAEEPSGGADWMARTRSA